MSDEVRQVRPQDSEISEEWVRMTEESDIRGVGAHSSPMYGRYSWVVSVWAQEYFRDDSLGIELRQRMEGALRAVAGVTDVYEHDNETWAIEGTPSGEALTRAAAGVVDELADRLRQGMQILDSGEDLP